MFGLARERSRPPVACRQRSPRLPTSETTMMSVSHASTRAALALVLASVSWSAGPAEQNAAGASEAERLQIQMTRKGFDNDLAGQLALGQQLVAKYPQSPRAWLALAGAQGALNENVDARESMAKALELSPKLYVAHV